MEEYKKVKEKGCWRHERINIKAWQDEEEESIERGRVMEGTHLGFNVFRRGRQV